MFFNLNVAKADMEVLVCLTAFQISFSPHSLQAVCESLMVDQLPGAASASPTSFSVLVL